VRPIPGLAAISRIQRSDRQVDAHGEPWFELLPRPVVHPDLAAAAALAAAHEQRSATAIEVGLGARPVN
jgi:hypothetical protein